MISSLVPHAKNPTRLRNGSFCVQGLEKKRAVLREVQEKLARLQEKFEANVKRKGELEHQVLCLKVDLAIYCEFF